MVKNTLKSFLKKGCLIGAAIAMIFSASVVGAEDSSSEGEPQIEQPAAPGEDSSTVSEAELKLWQGKKVILKSIMNAYKGVKITWEPLEGAEKYFVYGKRPGGKWSLLKQMSAGKTCAFTYEGGKSGNDYIFTVRAERCGVRNSYDEKGLTIKYLQTVKPVRPKNTAKGFEVSWDKVRGAQGYYVYRRAKGGSFRRIGETKATSYNDTSAVNGIMYTYAVRAHNGSTLAYYRESLGYYRISPGKFTVYKATSDKVFSFTWTKNAKVTGYKIGYRVNSGSLTCIDISGATNVNKKISGFQPGTRYTLYVRGYIKDGEKTYYAAWSPAITIVNSSRLEKEIRSIMARYNAEWSVYVKDLKTGQIVNINEKVMYPASVIKIAIMAGVFDQIKQKNLSYSAEIKNLLWNMVTLSNNECANRLIKACGNGNWSLGCRRINDFLHANGMKNTFVHTALQPAQTLGTDGLGRNAFTAHDTAILMEKVYRNQLVDEWSSKEMMNLLLNQQVRNNIIRSIPAGIKIASKSGDADSNHNDVAIIWGPKSTYIISIFSDQQSYAGVDGIRVISEKVYEYLNK